MHKVSQQFITGTVTTLCIHYFEPLYHGSIDHFFHAYKISEDLAVYIAANGIASYYLYVIMDDS